MLAVSQSAGTGAIATVKSLMASVKADGLSGGAVTHADTLIQEYEWHTGKSTSPKKGTPPMAPSTSTMFKWDHGRSKTCEKSFSFFLAAD